MLDFSTFIEKYDVVDFGAYKSIFIKYNRTDMETRYFVDGSRHQNIVSNDTITVPCTTLKVKFYGVKRGIGATQSITIDLKYNRPDEVNYYYTFDKTLQESVDVRDVDYNGMYFSDVDSSGYTEEAFPRKIRTRESVSGNYITVGKDFENRLDYVAGLYLNNPYQWWVIAEYNKLTNPFDVPAGTSLIIPDISEMYGDGGALRVPNIKLYQFY